MNNSTRPSSSKPARCQIGLTDSQIFMECIRQMIIAISYETSTALGLNCSIKQRSYQLIQSHVKNLNHCNYPLSSLVPSSNPSGSDWCKRSQRLNRNVRGDGSIVCGVLQIGGLNLWTIFKTWVVFKKNIFVHLRLLLFVVLLIELLIGRSDLPNIRNWALY